jgi:DNA-binding SARP family transcriptional activator
LKLGVRLKLTLLGGFQAQLDAGAALVLPTRKTQALLAYLALPLGQTHPREKLATLLWGVMSDAQARGNLRHALSRIRKALPRTARPGMVLDGPSVALDPSVVDVDVVRFEQLVTDGRPAALEQVAALYRGDQGRPGPARELLDPVYGRFTEGFDTPELQAAKTLLVRLGEPAQLSAGEPPT